MIVPILVAVGAAAGLGVVYMATRKPEQRLQPVTARRVPASTSTAVAAAKTNTIPLLLGKANVEPPARVKKEKFTPDFEHFLATHTAITPEYLGCETFEWGFCVQDVTEDATAAGGAAAVSSLIEWIASWTGLGVLTNAVCLRFRFKLHRFRMGPDYFWLCSEALPIGRGGGVASLDDLRKYAPHPAPRSGEYVRAWIDNSPEGWFDGESDGAYTIYFPDDGKWSIAISTADLRTLFRHDKMDITQLGSAQCGDGRWNLTTRAKAMNRYR